MGRKTALVTGASRGIGKAIALKFAKKGYNVVINCVNPSHEDLLLQVKKEVESYQVSCLPYLGDMGDYEKCSELFILIKKQFGGIDVLVDPKAKDADTVSLLAYLSPDQKFDKLLENQHVLAEPVVRNGKQATVGYAPDVWKTWE